MQVIPVIGYNFYTMFFIFVFWSFIGWIIEIVDMSYETGEFQNRGFLNMPICPIYGVGVLMILIFFRPFKETFLLLGVVSTVVCTAFEYFMGWLMEKVFHTRWWDYTHMRFNLHGYICLRNSLFFGSGCVLMYHWFEPWYEGFVAMIPVKAGWCFIGIMIILIIIDTACSVVAAAKLSSRLRRLDEISHAMLMVSEKTGMRLADGTLAVKSGINKARDTAVNAYDNVHEKAHNVREKVSEVRQESIERLKAEYEKLLEGDAFTNRILYAFPRMISKNYSRVLTAAKKRLHIHRFSRKFIKILRRRNANFRPTAEDLELGADFFEDTLTEGEPAEAGTQLEIPEQDTVTVQQ